jgi:hypothetical protein
LSPIARKIWIHVTISLLFVGILAAGFFYIQRYVQTEVLTTNDPPAIVIKNRPHWMSDFLVQRIADTARPPGAQGRSVFDRQLLIDARAALEKNPWISKVRDVRRAYANGPGDVLEIDCDYRAPVALVKWGDYYSLVDQNGFKLPEQYEARDVPKIVRIEQGRVDIRIIEGVKRPPPSPGKKWVGDDLEAGLEMISVLSDKPYAQEILKLDVSGVNGGRGDPQVVLVTKFGTRILWGRVPSAKDSFVEVDASKKLDRLRALYAQYGRVDAGKTSGLDIRFDKITYPGETSAGTGMEIRR